MSNVRRIDEAKSTLQQASEWVALLASGDASADDRARCAAWKRQHPSHRAAYEQLQESWERCRLAGAQVRRTIAADLAPHELARHLAATRRRSRQRRRIWGTAAAVLIAATVSALLMYPFDTGTLYRTAVGQRLTFTLPDRSTVQLNTDTELRVAFSDRMRRIELLRGEAYFNVEKDVDRPFVVDVGERAVRALGTAFVVRRHHEVVNVTVTEGVVEITQDTDETPVASEPPVEIGDVPSTKVSEGQRVEYDRRAISVAELDRKALDRELAWRRGLLIFDNAPLEELLRELERYTDTRLIIADGELRRLRVGGVFRSDDIEAVLEFLEKLNITVRRETPSTIYLTAAHPRPAIQ